METTNISVAMMLDDYVLDIERCVSLANTLEIALIEGGSINNNAFGLVAGILADLLRGIHKRMEKASYAT